MGADTLNPDELRVKEFLIRQGFNVIEHPLGKNHPPDFLLNDEIAVEARRLNLHKQSPSGPIALENERYKLQGRLVNIFRSIGKLPGPQWHVIATFHRPIGDLAETSRRIRDICKDFAEKKPHEKALRSIVSTALELIFIRSDKELHHSFNLAISNDIDEGCHVYQAILENTQFCVDSKNTKVHPFRNKFSQWWLLLVDHIDYCLSQDEWNMAVKQITNRSQWEKIIVISPMNQERFIEF